MSRSASTGGLPCSNDAFFHVLTFLNPMDCRNLDRTSSVLKNKKCFQHSFYKSITRLAADGYSLSEVALHHVLNIPSAMVGGDFVLAALLARSGEEVRSNGTQMDVYVATQHEEDVNNILETLTKQLLDCNIICQRQHTHSSTINDGDYSRDCTTSQTTFFTTNTLINSISGYGLINIIATHTWTVTFPGKHLVSVDHLKRFDIIATQVGFYKRGEDILIHFEDGTIEDIVASTLRISDARINFIRASRAESLNDGRYHVGITLDRFQQYISRGFDDDDTRGSKYTYYLVKRLMSDHRREKRRFWWGRIA